MSKAHYFVRNFNKQQILDLICYETRYPQKLTTTQKITRMYLSLLRIGQTTYFNQIGGKYSNFQKKVAKWRVEFDDMLQNDRDYQYVERMLDNYMNWHWKNFSTNMNIKNNRPYSQTSGRFQTFSNEWLEYDPLGYYTQKTAGQTQSYYGFPLLADYPIDEYYQYLQDETIIGDLGPMQDADFKKRQSQN